MGGHSGFGALFFLNGGGRTVACGTWFFVDGRRLPARLREKTRSVVATRDSGDGVVVVYPRSASRAVGAAHSPHSGHTCEAAASHDSLRMTYNSHPCHIDKEGWVDFDTPITLSLDDVDACQMCFEDGTSRLLHLLEEGLE